MRAAEQFLSIAATLYARCLFLPAGGNRDNSNGALNNQGSNGNYWSSTQNNASNGNYLSFSNGSTSTGNNNDKATGMSVRCVQEIIPHAPLFFCIVKY